MAIENYAEYGLVLVLSEQEYSQAASRYKEIMLEKLKNVESANIVARMDETGDAGEYIWVSSSDDRPEAAQNWFELSDGPFTSVEIQYLDSDNFDNPFLNAFDNNGYGYEPDGCYAIWAEKSMRPHMILNRESYLSVEEIVQEFQNKMARYLPEGFDWKKHIGVLSYCTWCD